MLIFWMKLTLIQNWELRLVETATKFVCRSPVRVGKSGGARVITHLIVNVENETLYLLKIYDKGDLENISEAELKHLLEIIKVL